MSKRGKFFLKWSPQMTQIDADGEKDKRTHAPIGSAITVHSELEQMPK